MDPSSITLEMIQATGRRLLVDRCGLITISTDGKKRPRDEFNGTGDVRRIVKIIDWISGTVFSSACSYFLKHRCEESLCEYVSNGDFIMAAILAGRPITCDPVIATRVGYHPNINVTVYGNSKSSIRATKQLLQLFKRCARQRPSTLEMNVQRTRDVISAASEVPARISETFEVFMAQSIDWQNAFSFDKRVFRFWCMEDKVAVRMLLEVLYSKGLGKISDIFLVCMKCPTWGRKKLPYGYHDRITDWWGVGGRWPYLCPRSGPCVV